jgi:MEMO1 family protein
MNMKEDLRAPAVSGRFYPADPIALETEVRRCLGRTKPEQTVSTIVAPHAGYMYSGAIAGETYAGARVPARVVVLCPNHTGLGQRRSISRATRWDLPGGALHVDTELRDLLASRADLRLDDAAHLREHAAEVHLPFLRAKNPNVKVVPICLGVLSLADCIALGENLARAIEEASHEGPGSILVVASTDMSHYIPAHVAKELDALAIDEIVAVDPEALYRIVTDREISMCGFVPTTVALAAARAAGAHGGTLVRYGNSGDTTGELDRVVGYAGALIS